MVIMLLTTSTSVFTWCTSSLHRNLRGIKIGEGKKVRCKVNSFLVPSMFSIAPCYAKSFPFILSYLGYDIDLEMMLFHSFIISCDMCVLNSCI